MILALADDFSGAAEIAGIGHHFGLRSELFTDVCSSSKADLVVVDTNTRSLSEEEAVAVPVRVRATTRAKYISRPHGVQVAEPARLIRLHTAKTRKYGDRMLGGIVTAVSAAARLLLVAKPAI